MKIQLNPDTEWQLREVPSTVGGRRQRGGVRTTVEFPPTFLLAGVSVDQTAEAMWTPTRRGVGSATLDLNVECAPGEFALVALRHPSGALTFHAPIERVQARRSARSRSTAATVRFRIPVRATPPSTQAGPARRGVLSKLVKVIVLKIKEKLIDAAVSKAIEFTALGAETLWWKARQLKEGWYHVDPASLRAQRLRPADLGALGDGQRALLFLHGTFSHATGAFADLVDAPGRFFDALRPLYGERVFAFNHFSVSRTPEENGRMLLEALPDRRHEFDVITHSRGALVLRHLVERRDLFGALARRFELGHAVLVAGPNAGTPLATPNRWEQTFGVVANLLEMFPDNPWTTGAEFVANGLVWLASHALQDLPGLGAMDANGEVITDLQAPPGPGASAYSALAANFAPDDALWPRLLDAGLDGFFAGANDLVVPTEGGWLVDAPRGPAIPAERIGCFGPGGNLQAAGDSLVNHLNFFAQQETVEFLLRALRREVQPLAAQNPFQTLPTRRLWRSGALIPAPSLTQSPTVAQAKSQRIPSGVTVEAPRGKMESSDGQGPQSAATVSFPQLPAAPERGDTFQLMILPGLRDDHVAQVLAMYGSARVMEPFALRNTPPDNATERAGDSRGRQTVPADTRAGSRFRRIIAIHEGIRRCLEGLPDKNGQVPSLPDDSELREFGELLFEALVSGNVRRLYDVARSETREGPLNVVLTCTLPWLAEKPWEFAFDPSRRKFLVTEETHFVRNVLTAVPAQRPPLRNGPLRLLVVAAQPVGTVELSSKDEEEMIRNGFQVLIDAGLATVDVLTGATPAALHGRIQTAQYDVVHFIGHGDFDSRASEGILLFESTDGGMHEVDTRTLKEILCGRGIHLIFLNACESGRDAKEQLNRGVAQALMEGGLPAVVANQYKVLDPSAVAFAQHFYWSLAHGALLGEAAREARIAVNYSITGEVIDWAVPVIYARDPDFRLCQRLAKQTPMPSLRAASLAQTETVRAAAARTQQNQKRTRVAVADLAHAFPELNETLATLNAMQDRLEFKEVSIVVPLGTWCLQKANGAGLSDSYLYADRFAARLKSKPRELGVDYLICITNRPMMCDHGRNQVIYNIYAWWGDTSDVPLIPFSTADYPIPPQGQVTDRIIANALVGSLAGLLAESDTHKRGPKDCPLYFNPERDFEQISGWQRFDEKCRKLLREKLSQELLTALEAVLNAFHTVPPPARRRLS